MPIHEPIDDELKDTYRKCRRGANGHWWDDFNPMEWTRPNGLFRAARHVLHFRCQRCYTVKHVGFDSRGGFLCRQYEYPEGYQMTAEERPPTADEQRLWLLRRDKAAGRKSRVA